MESSASWVTILPVWGLLTGPGVPDSALLGSVGSACAAGSDGPGEPLAALSALCGDALPLRSVDMGPGVLRGGRAPQHWRAGAVAAQPRGPAVASASRILAASTINLYSPLQRYGLRRVGTCRIMRHRDRGRCSFCSRLLGQFAETAVRRILPTLRALMHELSRIAVVGAGPCLPLALPD